MTETRRTAIQRLPTNKNFFLPIQSEFRVKRLPDVVFFCQSATLPGVSMQAVASKNPFTDIRHPGDVVMFNEFSVTFKVDEWMDNYMSVMDWIVRLGFPDNYTQYLELSRKPLWTGEGTTSDCSITFLDSRGRPKTEAIFENAFPVAVTDVVVDSRKQDTDFLEATATFVYTKYTLTRTT